MAYDAAVLLSYAGEEAGHVLEDDERDVEAVAEAHEARALHRRVNVEHAREVRGLVRDDADAAATETCEADDDVRRVVLLHFKEVALVNYGVDGVAYVVWLVRGFRDERVERLFRAVFGV